jgi:hypothetical protein
VVPEHVSKARHGTHVQSQLVGVAIVVDTTFGGEEVISGTGMQSVVYLVRGDNTLLDGAVTTQESCCGIGPSGVCIVIKIRVKRRSQLVSVIVLQ